MRDNVKRVLKGKLWDKAICSMKPVGTPNGESVRTKGTLVNTAKRIFVTTQKR